MAEVHLSGIRDANARPPDPVGTPTMAVGHEDDGGGGGGARIFRRPPPPPDVRARDPKLETQFVTEVNG